MVVLFPHWVAIRGKNQCTTNLIKVQSPIRTLEMLRVAERAEIFGVAAMRVPIFGLDGEGLYAINVDFHGLNLRVELTDEEGRL